MVERAVPAITIPVVTIALCLCAQVEASDLAGVSATEYYAATYFREALDHPNISKLRSRSAKIDAIARDLKWKPNKLKAAVDKVEALGGDPTEIAKMAEKAIRSAADRTRIKGHLLDVLINSDEPKHVVVYVRWQSTNARDVVKEAATIANVVAEETPLISTLSLSAIHPKAPTSSKDSVWKAKISSTSMAKIQKQRIDDYGDKLYKGLFEGIEEQPF